MDFRAYPRTAGPKERSTSGNIVQHLEGDLDGKAAILRWTWLSQWYYYTPAVSVAHLVRSSSANIMGLQVSTLAVP